MGVLRSPLNNFNPPCSHAVYLIIRHFSVSFAIVCIDSYFSVSFCVVFGSVGVQSDFRFRSYVVRTHIVSLGVRSDFRFRSFVVRTHIVSLGVRSVAQVGSRAMSIMGSSWPRLRC